MFCLLFTSKPRSRASLHIWTVRMLDISSGNVGSLDLALIDASKHSREHAAKLEMFLSKCGDMWNENISGCVCKSFPRGDFKRYVTALSKTNLHILHGLFTHASKTKRKNGLKFSMHMANTPRQNQAPMAIEANATNAIWRKIVWTRWTKTSSIVIIVVGI
ncbi:unnamed protein product [Bathycoccus prasinos]